MTFWRLLNDVVNAGLEVVFILVALFVAAVIVYKISDWILGTRPGAH